MYSTLILTQAHPHTITDTEQMEDDDDEQMDQQVATLSHNSAPTPVIVSVPRKFVCVCVHLQMHNYIIT